MTDAVVLFGHGTVERLDDLPAFVTNIRRGNPAPPELIAELRHRYEAIGGRSPFNDVARELARGVEREMGIPVAIAMRLWQPFAKDVLAELVQRGVQRVAFVPLAQHSGAVYAEAAKRAAAELGAALDVRCAHNWGRAPALLDAYAARVKAALERIAPTERPHTTTLFSAHSLPKSIIESGDPYETEFRASVDGVVQRLDGTGLRPMVAFQSQGPQVGAGGRRVEWLGPDLAESLDRIAARGDRHVLFAPIGFLADHVEVLYDLDVEAKTMATARRLAASRAESLNASPELARVIASIAGALLADEATSA